MIFGVSILSYISIFLFMLVFPFLDGALLTRFFKNEENKNYISLNLICGYMMQWAIVEIVCEICYLNKLGLMVLVICYVIFSVGLAVVSIVLNKKRLFEILVNPIDIVKKSKFLMIIPIVIIIFQVGYITTHLHSDDDDTWFIAWAERDYETGTVMQYDPYKCRYLEEGEEWSVNYRYSPFPDYYATIATVTGVKAVIIAHTFYPMIGTVLGYMVYFLIATRLLKDKYKEQAIFLILAAIILQYSGYSVFTQGTFFMVRLWQGKATLCGIIIPLMIYLGLGLNDKKTIAEWIFVLCTTTAGCLVSGMGVIIGAIVMGCMSLSVLIVDRNWKQVIFTFLCCTPNIICALDKIGIWG